MYHVTKRKVVSVKEGNNLDNLSLNSSFLITKQEEYPLWQYHTKLFKEIYLLKVGTKEGDR